MDVSLPFGGGEVVMDDRMAVHALWAGAVMYSVAIVALAAVTAVRHAQQVPPDPADVIATKAMALFGPIVSVVGIVLSRRNGRRPVAAPQDSQTARKEP